MYSISAASISKDRNGQVLFRDFNFNTEDYNRIAIMGSTGAGKTTLLKMMAGLMQPDSGTIFIGDERVLGPDEKLIAGHPLIGYLSQHYELRNNYYVRELLDMSNKLTAEKSNEIFDLCNITHLLNRRTDALSGGERQRIALAKILIAEPKWLLLDEPYSNLDLHQKKMIMLLLKEIGDYFSVRMMMVSHDAGDMLSWADDLMIIEDGKILQRGTPLSLYHHPLNVHVAGLLGEYNIFNALTANLLTQSENFNAVGKQYLIRPEHIFVSDNGRGIKAEVTEVLFKGGYYLVRCHIKAHDCMVMISVPSTSLLDAGATIFMYTLPQYVVSI